jgi:hypothetical protein
VVGDEVYVFLQNVVRDGILTEAEVARFTDKDATNG